MLKYPWTNAAAQGRPCIALFSVVLLVCLDSLFQSGTKEL